MNKPVATHISRWFDRAQLSLALAMALSLPWELYQRIPYVELTITKVAGALLVMAAAGRMAFERRWPARRTGLEAPLLVMLAVMAATTLVSADRSASIAQLAMYASYFVIFCALSGVVDSPARARWLSGALVASSAGVGLLALACRLGVATPTLVETTRITGRWTTRDAWFDLTSRMAPASADFNQGVLPLLVAFCLVLFLFLMRRKGQRWAALAAGLLVLAGIVISLSRSSIVLALGLGVAFVALALRRGAWRIAAALALSALGAIALLVIVMRPEGVFQRATQLVGSRDSSYEGRVAVLEAGVSLLPDYWLTGTGLGASDGVMARSAHGARVGGITIHSVPLKLLVETGVAGLLALVWLYWRALRLHLRGLKRNDAESRAHSVAFLALGATVFLVTAVQPFMALALFPFLLAIAAGPLAGAAGRLGEAASDGRGRLWTAGVAAGVFGIVLFNIIDFHKTVDRVWSQAEALVQGVQAERNGDLQKAANLYRDGYAITTRSERPGEPQLHPLPRYYQQAAEVLDTSYAYERMRVRHRRISPAAACAFGRGRVALAQGSVDEAAEWLLEALSQDGQAAQVHLTLAELWWETGEFKKALQQYDEARNVEAVRENADFRQFVAPIDRYIEEHRGDSDIGNQLRRAQFLRRRGRWPEAAEQYKDLLLHQPQCAEALFNVGVQCEVEGEPEKALALYRQAAQANPRHHEVLRRLAFFMPAGPEAKEPL